MFVGGYGWKLVVITLVGYMSKMQLDDKDMIKWSWGQSWKLKGDKKVSTK